VVELVAGDHGRNDIDHAQQHDDQDRQQQGELDRRDAATISQKAMFEGRFQQVLLVLTMLLLGSFLNTSVAEIMNQEPLLDPAPVT
jgi:hypothetical protein